MSLLELRDVTFQVEEKIILQGISLEIERGDFLGLVGPSGSGKSSLLKLCNDLISPSQGDLFFKGKNYRDHDPIQLRRQVLYLAQTPYLFGETVRENIEFPYSIRNKKLDLDRVEEVFSLFKMPLDYLDQEVGDLSGGEKQRIALIRGLLILPEVLLLDEVTSALDPENKDLVRQILCQLNREGTTLVAITHDQEGARRYAKRILTLDEGKIVSLEEVQA
ncbi:MAG: ATP-binding cassette domain-containing protein [Tissierellia bacterium]|nr:ATP-binding cassette domain-containing protein [Tissierellia bacterium]